jgi:hypothetical protein
MVFSRSRNEPSSLAGVYNGILLSSRESEVIVKNFSRMIQKRIKGHHFEGIRSGLAISAMALKSIIGLGVSL